MVVGSRGESVPISGHEFLEIRRAKRLIEFGVGLEEKLNLLLENYAELELELLRLSLQDCVFFGTGTLMTMQDDVLQLINRRITNYLSSAQGYIDQTRHAFSEFYGTMSAQYESMRRLTSTEYDSVLGYRAMDQIRDAAQHRNWPIHLATFERNRDESPSERALRFGLTPMIDVSALEADPKFKKSVLAELKTIARGDSGGVEAMPLIRAHAEALGRIHGEARKITCESLSAADARIASAIGRGAAAFATSETGPLMVLPVIAGLAAAKFEGDTGWTEIEYLSDRLSRRRVQLEKKNEFPYSLSRRYVSSQ